LLYDYNEPADELVFVELWGVLRKIVRTPTRQQASYQLEVVSEKRSNAFLLVEFWDMDEQPAALAIGKSYRFIGRVVSESRMRTLRAFRIEAATRDEMQLGEAKLRWFQTTRAEQ
jgi:hypothetical protein